MLTAKQKNSSNMVSVNDMGSRCWVLGVSTSRYVIYHLKPTI